METLVRIPALCFSDLVIAVVVVVVTLSKLNLGMYDDQMTDVVEMLQGGLHRLGTTNQHNNYIGK